MQTNNPESNNTETSTLKLIQDINSGELNPKSLDKEARQCCVEFLFLEGYKQPQIAQVLKCSEKTVYRDMREISKRNSLAPDVEFAKQFIGEVFQKAMNSHSFLIRLARSKDVANSEKIGAEFAAWKILKELIERLQSLGYLPQKPTEVFGSFYHHSENDEDNSPEAMRKTLLGIEEAAKDAGVLDEGVRTKIDAIKERIKQSEIAYEIRQLENKTQHNKEDGHEK